MLNINGKILDNFNESEYYLFSILLNYGKKSHPKNEVLLSKTGWGEQKLKRVKKSLKDKGILAINARFGGKNGRGRNSNQYVINTKLASKFNGVKQADFNTVEIKLDDFNTVEINTDDFKRDENQGGYKVLKIEIIESIKLLKEECVKEKDTQIKNLEKEILSLKTELSKLKEAEKSIHIFPDNSPKKSYIPEDKRPDKNLPFDISSASKTLKALYPDDEKQKLKEEFKSIYGFTIKDGIIKKCLNTFVTDGIARYYTSIRDIEKLQTQLYMWINREVKFQATGSETKPTKQNNHSSDGTPSYMMGLKY